MTANVIFQCNSDGSRFIKSMVFNKLPSKGDHFYVVGSNGKASFEVSSIVWSGTVFPCVYLTGVGDSSFSFVKGVLLDGGLEEIRISEKPIENSSSFYHCGLFDFLKNENLQPTKTILTLNGTHTAVWHVDNDDDRWVRLETHVRHPGFLLTFFDAFLGVKTEVYFAENRELAASWIKMKLAELGKTRSPWSRLI